MISLYLFPYERSTVTKWLTEEWSLLNVDFCLNEDGGKEQPTEVQGGALQDLGV